MFPQELIDIIIDYLHADAATLKNCALVSRLWTPSCRVHLFRHVELDLVQVSRRPIGLSGATSHSFPRAAYIQHDSAQLVVRKCTALRDCLSSAPYIALFIRRLLIRPGHHADMGRDLISTILSTIIPQLTNLMHLDLKTGRWSNLSFDFQALTHHVLRLPSLSRLVLDACIFDSMNELTSILSMPSGLKDISILDVTMHDPVVPSLEERDTSSPVSYPATLYIAALSDPLSQWLTHISSPINIGQLHRLYIHERTITSVPTARLLRATNISLQHLELTAPDHPYGRRESISCDWSSAHSLWLST